MSTKRHLTDDDYTEMAADYETNPPTADEIAGPITVNPAYLRTGRPAGGGEPKGKTPALPVRLPEPIRVEIAHRVKAGESASASELIRKAVVEYFEHHPTKAS